MVAKIVFLLLKKISTLIAIDFFALIFHFIPQFFSLQISSLKKIIHFFQSLVSGTWFVSKSSLLNENNFQISNYFIFSYALKQLQKCLWMFLFHELCRWSFSSEKQLFQLFLKELYNDTSEYVRENKIKDKGKV